MKMVEQYESLYLKDSEEDGTGESSGGEDSGGNCSASNAQEETFVKKETRRVLTLRLLVVAVLLAASAAVSVVVFYITHKGEEFEFESQYEAAADKVNDAFLSIARDKMGPAGSLVVALVAHGIDHTRQWPFVALSSFQQRASTAKRQSGSIFIATHPIVWREDRLAWENYTRHDVDINWYHEGRQYQVEIGVDGWDTQPQVKTEDPNLDLSSGIASHIYNFRRDDPTKAMISPTKPFYLPVWQTSPVTKRTIVNQNRASNSDGILTCLEQDAVVFEGMQNAEPGDQDSPDPITSEIAWLLSLANGENTKYQGDIFTTVYFPVYDSFNAVRSTVGVMGILIYWQNYFRHVLPEHLKGIVLVLEDGCDEPYTYQINGEEVVPLGRGDLHDKKYDRFERSASFLEIKNIDDGTKNGLRLNHEKCPYQVRVYPSTLFYEQYSSNTPIAITFAVALVFVFTVFMFFLYDRLVEKRQQLIMRKAKQTHGIVASLFPKNVRDRILQEHDTYEGDAGTRIKSFMSKGEQPNDMGTAAIADLFPDSTVFFSDISGFTAWSSTREPSQVFVLLQALYQTYDRIATRLKVFKVETIGDSYVAVTGLPDPQPRHAVIMARFAAECMIKTAQITRELEPLLGPGTGELTIRIGLHSGPVTAGVLMGDRARFQLFGDTVNTASRMESTGKPGLIQVSKETSDLLIKAGKQHWVQRREDDVNAKGKGVLKTFWLTPYSKRRTSNESSGSESKYSIKDLRVLQSPMAGRNDRLEDWIVELLASYIRNIKVKQHVTETVHTPLTLPVNSNRATIDELVECLDLPPFDAKLAVEYSRDKTTEIAEEVKSLLREYVKTIASAYRDNPFHNFEHACHVTMCASKLLSRIVAADSELKHCKAESNDKIASNLQDYKHIICSDPIAMFAIVFSALIHDVDHRGISNTQLMKEEPVLAEHFKNKSIAEQNSLEIAWNLLVSDRFKALREGIFVSQEEFAHFRQVVVNVVFSTDIFDKKMSNFRKKQWEIAFTTKQATKQDSNTINNMRATVAIEHIIQASDVAHTMQHWHVYRKWNKMLFHEMLLAYRKGRGADPRSFWYKGELEFFDSYVIPLAKNLKDCKAFGVSSEECLNYAIRNRDEWEACGEEVVEEMKKEFAEKYAAK